MEYILEDDNYCFVCGEKNPIGLHLTFILKGSIVVSEFIPKKVHQGYKDIVHGGIISTILDEIMVKTALLQGIPAITAEMRVRFRTPLIVGEKISIEASIVKMNKKIVEVSANIKKIDNILVAEGYSKLVRQD
ncbi:MAG: PaaI family thioesterase [Nitrospirae bacterium]|nr:PaaI family thioesterase [Nitrospirota bacterium]